MGVGFCGMREIVIEGEGYGVFWELVYFFGSFGFVCGSGWKVGREGGKGS